MGSPLRKPITKNLPNFPGGKTITNDAGLPVQGWYRMPDEWWDHLRRLQRGLVQRMLIEYVWACMVPRNNKSAIPEWSAWFTYAELAEKCGCTAEQLREDARDAAARHVLILDDKIDGKRQHGKARFQVPWRKWCNLPDYVPGPRPVPDPEKLKTPQIHTPFKAAVAVDPGKSHTIHFAEVPKDFAEICFRNTGTDGIVTLAGGGFAEGGILFLDTVSGKTPVQQNQRVKKKRQERTLVSEDPKPEPVASEKLVFTSPLAETLAQYGIISDSGVSGLIQNCQTVAPECSLEEIELAVKFQVATAAPNTRKMSSLILKCVPQLFAGHKYRTQGAAAFDVPEEQQPINEKRQRMVKRLKILAEMEKQSGTR